MMMRRASLPSHLWNGRLHPKDYFRDKRLSKISILRIIKSNFPTISEISTSVREIHNVPTKNSELFKVSLEVSEALKNNAPVVALESAIITHGMPFPDNIEVALHLEKIARELGVVPATVGIVGGIFKVGLSREEIEILGSWRKESNLGTSQVSQKPTLKVSRRDLPFVMTHKLNGGTTVAGTIIGAVKAGIPIFATGGLGGVHRGAEVTFDVSADLKELGRSPIGVVSAGVKSILDIGKTLEYMETEGICVAVLKKDSGELGKDENEKGSHSIAKQIGTTKFPSFFTAHSPFTAPYSVRTELEAAHLLHSSLQLELKSGVLIAVPIPEIEGSSSGETIDDAIHKALQYAEKRSIKGKDITPFLLSEVNRLTAGLSLIANKLLIESNVRAACQIAHNLSLLRRGISPPQAGTHRYGVSSSQSVELKEQKNDNGKLPRHDRPVVIGGTSLDIVLAIQEDDIVEDGRTHLTQIQTYPGGVSRNIAEALKKLNHDPIFISAIGADLFGRELLHQFEKANLDHSRIKSSTENMTAVYAALLRKNGECAFGMGDMTMHSEIRSDDIIKYRNLIESAPIIIMDANIPVDSMTTLMKLCKESETPLWFEPTEVRKASKICHVPLEYLSSVAYISPNFKELESIVKELGHSTAASTSKDMTIQTCFNVFPGLKALLLTQGKDGIKVVYRNMSDGKLDTMAYPAPAIPISEIRSVSGAGDCLNAGFISGILSGLSMSQCSEIATECAAQSLKSLRNVPDTFSFQSRR